MYAISKDVSGLSSHWIIECKKWATKNKVEVDIVRALYGVKSNLRVGNALLATTSHFTRGAKQFKTSRYDLELKDCEDVLGWISKYGPNPDGTLYLRSNQLILPGNK
jgi:restriction system protein